MDARITSTLALVVTAAGLAAVTAPSHAAVSADGDCGLVRLAEPDGYRNGGVMDIERVGDQVVYYGNSLRKGHQRAFVWSGLDGEPTRVGPQGYEQDIALELTSTGLVNGVSENPDGTDVAWVQDLASGQLTVLDTDSGPRGTDHGYAWIRRVNASGAAAGEVAHSDLEEGEQGHEAVGFASPEAPMTVLTGSIEAETAGALGINDAGDRAGYMGTDFLPEDPNWLIFEPTIWRADGTVVELARDEGGLDAMARAVKNDGTASGLAFFGSDPAEAHIEAAYWPTPDTIVGLGLIRGGGYSDVYGMDEGGWLVGLMDRLAPASRYAPGDFAEYSFLVSPETEAGSVRVLPSLFGRHHDLPWKQWAGSAMHAVNGELDQAGTGTHWKWGGKDRMVFAPTVFVNASECGREVRTVHTPFWELPERARPTVKSTRPTAESLWARVLAQP